MSALSHDSAVTGIFFPRGMWKSGEREPWPRPISTALKQAGQQAGTGGLRAVFLGYGPGHANEDHSGAIVDIEPPPQLSEFQLKLNWHSVWMVETSLAAVNWRDAKYHWKDTINFIAPWLFQSENFLKNLYLKVQGSDF